MENPPKIQEIADRLRRKKPLGIGENNEEIIITDIDPKLWSGHFNFLVITPKQKVVLRFKGPEWGETSKGIIDEYDILKFVEPYRVAPRALCLERDSFEEPMLLEEYLEGRLLKSFPQERQKELFIDAAKLISRINGIDISRSKNSPFFRSPYLSYKRSKESWCRRLAECKNNPLVSEWAERIESLLPKAESMLDRFEVLLKKVLEEYESFIFVSAHIGHCISTEGGLKFLNWENVSYGDPSYTLAVFLASIQNFPDFAGIKKKMVETYLEYRYIPNFSQLIEQRLAEREVSNLIWSLWASVQKGISEPIGNDSGIAKRFEKVGNSIF